MFVFLFFGLSWVYVVFLLLLRLLTLVFGEVFLVFKGLNFLVDLLLDWFGLLELVLLLLWEWVRLLELRLLLHWLLEILNRWLLRLLLTEINSIFLNDKRLLLFLKRFNLGKNCNSLILESTLRWSLISLKMRLLLLELILFITWLILLTLTKINNLVHRLRNR